MRDLRVVMTLGPASEARGVRARLSASADEFRLNSSHLDAAGLRRWLEGLAELFDEEGCEKPVVVDLQGAKLRIGEVPEVSSLPPRVRLICTRERSGTPRVIPVPEPDLFEQVRPGETLTMNDSRVELRVESVGAGELLATVVRDGPLSSRKGINRPEHPFELGSLREADRAAIEVVEDFSFAHLAFSYALDGKEAAQVRSLSDRRLVGKVERPEALAHLEELDAAYDELWLCRGDLGAQAGLTRLGPLQEEFTRALPARAVPCLLAGQVLEHMTCFPRPTRSEVVHLHDVARAGWRGIVLSDETAVGKHPEAVAALVDELRAGCEAAPVRA